MLALLASRSTSAQLIEQGGIATEFTQQCATCHGNPAMKTAPDVATLRQFSPESIYAALTTGVMRVQAQGLSDDVKRALTVYLAGREPGVTAIADAKALPNHCGAGDPTDFFLPAWNGWGKDSNNWRYQTASDAGISASQVPQLQLKWAFGFPGATLVYTQPTLVGGRVFVGLDNGYVYAIGAKTGCVTWSFAAKAGVRSAVTVGPVKGHPGAKYAAYFGDIRGDVYAVNAETGMLLWERQVETEPVARISGGPVLAGGWLYVPVSSMAEVVSGPLSYSCCTFRGSVVALDANTGRQIWKTHSISEPLVRWKKNRQGTQLYGPSGVSIWSSPTVDPARDALYFGTGNAYTPPPTSGSDAVMALDLKTGKRLWSVQNTPKDAWIAGCFPPEVSDNCADPAGPDYDMSSSPMLVKLPNGRQLLIAGQKSGAIFAHDPDAKGKVVWTTHLEIKVTDPFGEVVWGGATDGQTVYYGLNRGGIAALNASDGQKKWLTPLDPIAGREMHRGDNGPLTLIPGVVFSGGWDGVVRALSADDGHVIWQYDTAREFDTVDGVKAKGGSMGAAGPMVAGGMLFVPSGYVGVQNGMPGNVLLAFAP